MDHITTSGDRVIELQLSVLVFQEGEFYVSYCPSLEMTSYGDSIQDAKDAFDEAMRIYFEDCQKNKTLQQDLISHGWKFIQHNNDIKPEPPSQVQLEIPAGLLRTQFNENWKVAYC